MSDFQIPDKDLISVVDGAADSLLIYDASANALKRTTRNVLLNLTSAPLGLSDSQSPTNKTFDNTNIFTIRDDRFTLQDNSDTTKQAVFQLSGISTGTTRTYTLPNASSTLVDLSSSQTLTNKTLTSPTLNTATITNPTIIVDTVSEYTAANGVTIDGVKLKDGALATNNSVVTANITDAAVTPAKLLSGTGSSWTWQSWTPSWTNFTTGNGTLSYAKYIQTGKIVDWRIQFVLGNTSAVSGIIGFSLPVTASADLDNVNDSCFATGALIDVSGFRWFPIVQIGTTSRMDVYYLNTSVNHANISSTAPFTWTTNDIISLAGSYEAA